MCIQRMDLMTQQRKKRKCNNGDKHNHHELLGECQIDAFRLFVTRFGWVEVLRHRASLVL